MESNAEKAVVTWVVGPTEDVVQALMERLVCPFLPRNTVADTTKPPSNDEQKTVARQMHAVVLLYNYYHRKQKPDLKFLDLASFCNLAVVLKPSLAAFMEVTQENKLWELNGAECQLSLTEKAIKKACDISAALDASVEVPGTECWPISKVAVLLIDSKKENCKLQFGAVTEGVWSLFEKELDGLEESSGGKRKRDNLNASTAGDEILHICHDVVRGITGTESNELVVLDSGVSYSLSEEKSATQFYLVQVPGSSTISPKEQIPLNHLVEKLKGPLAEKDFGIWSTTEVVNYYHMLPYAGFISRLLSGKNFCSPSIHHYVAQSTIKICLKDAVKDSEHTDNDSSTRTINSSDETPNKNNSDECLQKSKLSSDQGGSISVNIYKNATQRRDTAKKNSSSRSYMERLVEDMNERENGQNLVMDNVTVWKRSTKPRVSPVTSTKEPVNDNQLKVFKSKRCSPKNVAADMSEMQNKCENTTASAAEIEGRRIGSPNILNKKETKDCQNKGSVSHPSPNSKGLQSVINICKTDANNSQVTSSREKLSLSLSTHIDNNHDPHEGTAWNSVELVDNLKNPKNTGCRDGKVSGESEVGFSSDQIRNAFAANANKSAGHGQVCKSEGTTKLTSVVGLDSELASSDENALALLCIKREQLFSQVRCKDTLAQYENCIERIWDGGEVGLARRRIQSIMSRSKHWMLMNETEMHDKDLNSKSQTEKQSSMLSGLFVPGKSKCQDLEYTCQKNNWGEPRILVEQSEDTVKLIKDKKRNVLTYNELCAKMGKKQKTSTSKALLTVPNVEVGMASEVALNSTEKATSMPLGKSGSEALNIVLGQGSHLHLNSSAIRGVGDLLLDNEVHQMGMVEASAYALPLIVKLLHAMISINKNAMTSEEKESVKFAYQDVLKDNENLKASLYAETTKSKAFEQQLEGMNGQLEGMKGQLEEAKSQVETERVKLKLVRAEVEKIEARAILQTRRDLMMEVINGESANWVPVEQVKKCDEMLWSLDNGDGLEGRDDHEPMEEE